jgi:hypothetical protein
MARADMPPAFDERTTLMTMLDYVRKTAVLNGAGLDDVGDGRRPRRRLSGRHVPDRAVDGASAQRLGRGLPPIASGLPQPGRAQPTQQLPRVDRERAGVHQRLVPLARDVIVVVIEPSHRNLLGGGKGVQLVVGLVADQVRPHPAVRRPAWRVDQDAHAATAQPVSISPA